MKFTEIEKKKIESLRLDEHEWDWYGAEAIVHGYLVKEALAGRDVVKDFGVKHRLDSNNRKYGAMLDDVDLICKDGLYLPKRFGGRDFVLFGWDHSNRVRNYWEGGNSEEAYEVIKNVNSFSFSLGDFKDEDFLKKAGNFSVNFWDGCKRFYGALVDAKKNEGDFEGVRLEKKLVDYYNKKIFSYLSR